MTRSTVVLQNITSEGVLNCPNMTQTAGCEKKPCKCFGGEAHNDQCDVNAPQNCRSCDKGKFLDAMNGQATTPLCKFCAYGQYQNQDYYGQDSCKSCIRGKYTSDARSPCKSCIAGKYQDTINEEYSCKDCSHGKYQEQDYNNPSSCEFCGIHEYTPNSAAACRACGPGRYQDESENTEYECKQCEAGRHYFYQSYYQRGCKICTAGKYTDDNHDFATLESCTECPNGRYNLDKATNLSLHNSVETCQYCDKGYDFRSSVGHTPAENGCLICQAGRYQDLGKHF